MLFVFRYVPTLYLNHFPDKKMLNHFLDKKKGMERIVPIPIFRVSDYLFLLRDIAILVA